VTPAAGRNAGARVLRVDQLVALLPSPLLGPAVWRPTAEALSLLGWTVTTVPTTPVPPTGPDDVLATFLSALPPDEDVILVPHSNAGLYVPPLVGERRVVASVFVDAGLPPSSGRVPLAPEAFLAFLRQRADAEGVLPVWTQWWDEADVQALFAGAEVREQVEREQRRLPLSYFQQSMTVSRGWDEHPGAYLAFGETYSAERHRAERRGWPSITLAGRHLHTLVAPTDVATAIDTLLRKIVTT